MFKNTDIWFVVVEVQSAHYFTTNEWDGVHSIDILEYIERLQLICRGLLYLFGRFDRGGGVGGEIIYI